MCLMHFTPPLAASPDILNKVTDGDRSLDITNTPPRFLCWVAPPLTWPSWSPWSMWSPTSWWTPWPGHWRLAWSCSCTASLLVRIKTLWSYNIYIFFPDLATANAPVQGYPLWQALLAFNVVMWIIQVNDQLIWIFKNCFVILVYWTWCVWGAGPCAAGFLGPSLHHGTSLCDPGGPFLLWIQETVLPGLHEGGRGGDQEIQSQ